MRTQMESGLTDEAVDQMAEQVKGRFERDEVEAAAQVDQEDARPHGLGEGKLRDGRVLRHGRGRPGVDALFDAMSPGDSGGKSVDIYEVLADQRFDA